MPGKFYPVPARTLLRMILSELTNSNSVLGIPVELFAGPDRTINMRSQLFGHYLETPLGVAAGPHTQMAQNIIAAWLTGARYIELKTVQTLDTLDIPKPCIDMQDEGYNCEWSQELTVRESFEEYLKAWVIIHILNRKLGWGELPGIIFNMSVGYDLAGIRQENVQWFLDSMNDCTTERDRLIAEIADLAPEADFSLIKSCISDNVTLSTMHGCPPGEIKEIAAYLITERHLHTFVKLNPTLLGPGQLRDILNKRLRFKATVPDEAFEHDLKYPDAGEIIRYLQSLALQEGLSFGLKLTNTLETVNNRNVFDSEVDRMYMSGRALHPLSVTLADQIRRDFGNDLMLSFSAGADAFNISDLLSCGFVTVTMCSDLLKPGGYMRLAQYVETINKSMALMDAVTIGDFVQKSAGAGNIKEAASINLGRYAEKVISMPRYHSGNIRTPDIKGNRELGYFDCISAPCRETCATEQDVPDYLWFTSRREYDKAFDVILEKNPFPSVTGMICDHLCQTRCTRISYDDPLQIREVKRFISGFGRQAVKSQPDTGLKVAVIGAGPAGLTCAFYLTMAGFSVDVFEALSEAGGMVRYAIPGFRLTDDSVKRDIAHITETGVRIHYDSPVDRAGFERLRKQYDYLFAAAGAWSPIPLSIPGADASVITDPLTLLGKTRRGEKPAIGKDVIVIGGGNSAMDAARTALRLAGTEGRVTIVYRRTLSEMPADQGEIEAVISEGARVIELATPERIVTGNGVITELVCSRMELGGAGADGRPLPVRIPDSEFTIPCDTLIPAIGQRPDNSFLPEGTIIKERPGSLSDMKGIYAGGDLVRGASTAINAIGDGRRAAFSIMTDAGIKPHEQKIFKPAIHSTGELVLRRGRRIYSECLPSTGSNEAISLAFSDPDPEEEAMKREAERCLWCDEMCSTCATVCPNTANRVYETIPQQIKLKKASLTEEGNIEISDDGVFEIRQKYQILNLADFCNECGNCNTFCPSSEAPFRQKPRFYLTVGSFNEAGEGYHLAILPGKRNLIYKKNNHFITLTELPDSYLFESDYVAAEFTRDNFSLEGVRFRTPCIREAHFRMAAEMLILLRGAATILS